MVVHACNPSYLRGCGRRISWIQEVEAVVSLDQAIALQPGQQEQNYVSKKKKNASHFPMHPKIYKLVNLTSDQEHCYKDDSSAQ